MSDKRDLNRISRINGYFLSLLVPGELQRVSRKSTIKSQAGDVSVHQQFQRRAKISLYFLPPFSAELVAARCRIT